MSEEFQKTMFQPFERAATSTVSKTEGTGLGMSITKRIVDLMGGTISVSSRLNEGTTITVSLPMQTEQQTEEIIPDYFKDLRSLVVDDDREVCENTVQMLEELGMHSDWVLNGAEAVTRVDAAHKRRQDYHAVILDWLMPDMDGVETARQIRRKVGRISRLLFLAPMTGQTSRKRPGKPGLLHLWQNPSLNPASITPCVRLLCLHRRRKAKKSDLASGGKYPDRCCWWRITC